VTKESRGRTRRGNRRRPNQSHSDQTLRLAAEVAAGPTGRPTPKDAKPRRTTASAILPDFSAFYPEHVRPHGGER